MSHTGCINQSVYCTVLSIYFYPRLCLSFVSSHNLSSSLSLPPGCALFLLPWSLHAPSCSLSSLTSVTHHFILSSLSSFLPFICCLLGGLYLYIFSLHLPSLGLSSSISHPVTLHPHTINLEPFTWCQKGFSSIQDICSFVGPDGCWMNNEHANIWSYIASKHPPSGDEIM